MKLSVGAELPDDLAAALLGIATVWMRQAERLTPEAVETISRASAAASGAEVAFLCRVDPSTGRIGDVQVQAVGNLLGVRRPVTLVGPDTMLLHTHPHGMLPFPSEDDRRALATVPVEVGYAICVPSGRALHVVREPSVSRPAEDGRPPHAMAIPGRGLQGGVLLCDGKLLVFDRRAQEWRTGGWGRAGGLIGRAAQRLLGRGSP